MGRRVKRVTGETIGTCAQMGYRGNQSPSPEQPMGYRGNKFTVETSQRVTVETSPMLSQRDTGETILLQWVTGETFPPFARVIARVGLPGKPFQGFPGNPSWDGFPGNPKGVTWKPFCKVYRRNLPGNGLPRKPLVGNGLPGKPRRIIEEHTANSTHATATDTPH